jgi:hypothetical protein
MHAFTQVARRPSHEVIPARLDTITEIAGERVTDVDPDMGHLRRHLGQSKRPDLLQHLGDRRDPAAEPLQEAQRRVVHLLAVGGAGVLDKQAVEAAVGPVTKRPLDAHVRRGTREEQRSEQSVTSEP